ncbi:MAG: DUF2318 domain-containing protein [Candidatus Diapherotrites archaeon]
MKKILLALAIFALVVFAGCASNSSTGQVTATTGAGGSSSTINVPLSSISAQAKWFEYDSSGVKVRFFAVKAGDGSIKTAFDSCDVCYDSKKGYRQEGDNMVCNNCGNRYPISGLGTENRNPGGCWPSFLPSKVVGDNVVIEKSELDKGRSRFV